MELSFSTKEIRRICKNRNSAVKKLGSECARFLHDRLADIDAAEDGSDLKLLSALFQLDDQLGTVTSALRASIVLKAEAGPEPPPLKWSAPIIRKAEDHRWRIRDPSPKRLS